MINLLPPAPDHVDWVLVARITGQLAGPIHRPPTHAEIRACAAEGVTRTQLARLTGLSGGRLTQIIDGVPA